MKRILLLFLMSTAVSLCAAGAEPETEQFVPCYKYRVYLKDKGRRTASLMKHPERYLSPRSIERRQRQGLAIDCTDLPVNGKYIRAVAATGVEVLIRSRWNNTLVVQCEDTTLIDAVRELPFVREAVQVAHYEKSPLNTDKDRFKKVSQEKYEEDSTYYANGKSQITALNGLPLHEAGFRGEGMCIAVIDGGFLNTDTIPAMQNTRIAGSHNFVMPGVSVFDWNNDHGQAVLSCMGANTPHVMVGTAPEAEYWLLISEDGGSEQPVEEDNWTAAIEFADSIGADVINSSLGYGSFDAPYGKRTFASRIAHGIDGRLEGYGRMLRRRQLGRGDTKHDIGPGRCRQYHHRRLCRHFILQARKKPRRDVLLLSRRVVRRPNQARCRMRRAQCHRQQRHTHILLRHLDLDARHVRHGGKPVAGAARAYRHRNNRYRTPQRQPCRHARQHMGLRRTRLRQGVGDGQGPRRTKGGRSRELTRK